MMEDTIAFGLLGTYALFGIACLVILVYLIFRRIRLKKDETFEDRDN